MINYSGTAGKAALAPEVQDLACRVSGIGSVRAAAVYCRGQSMTVKIAFRHIHLAGERGHDLHPRPAVEGQLAVDTRAG